MAKDPLVVSPLNHELASSSFDTLRTSESSAGLFAWWRDADLRAHTGEQEVVT